MKFKAGELVEMDSRASGIRDGLFLVLRLDIYDDPVVQVLRPRRTGGDFVGEIKAFFAADICRVDGGR